MHAARGERDTQRLFKRFGCTLPVPVSSLEFTGTTGSCKLPFLKVSDYLSYLLRRYPELLLGGYKRGVEARELLKNFWQGYRDFHPEHLAFTKFTPEELCRVIPLAIHGDKGRGYLKLPILKAYSGSPKTSETAVAGRVIAPAVNMVVSCNGHAGRGLWIKSGPS